MPASGQVSSSTHRDDLQARDPPPFHICTYARSHRSLFETFRFAAMLSHGTAVVFSYELGSCNTAGGAWPKRWKHCGGRGALELFAGSSVMHSPPVCCGEEVWYQQRLVLLLTEVRRRPKLITVILSDVSVLPKIFGNLYYVVSRSYWVRKCFFKSRHFEHQKILEVWHDV